MRCCSYSSSAPGKATVACIAVSGGRAAIREYSLGIKSSSLPSRPQGGNIRWDEISLLGRQLRPVMPQMSSMPAQGISCRAGWYDSSTASIVGVGCGGLKSLHRGRHRQELGTGDD